MKDETKEGSNTDLKNSPGMQNLVTLALLCRARPGVSDSGTSGLQDTVTVTYLCRKSLYLIDVGTSGLQNLVTICLGTLRLQEAVTIARACHELISLR